MTQQEIDQAIKDQIGTDPVAALPSNPDIAAALANYKQWADAVAGSLNASLKAIYLSAFQDYANNTAAGKVATAPTPPMAYISAKASDGWTYVIKGTDPVCPVQQLPPATPVVTSFQHIDYVQNVPVGDTMPLGYIATAPDGTRWQKQSSPTPFGTAYFYARL
jgi:hypothetical protein